MKKSSLLKVLFIIFAIGFFFFCGSKSSVKADEQKQAGITARIMSLEECLKEGLSNYQSIKIAEYDKIWAEAKLSEAKTSRFLPQFNVTNLFGPIPDVPSGYGPPNFKEYSIDWSSWNIFYMIKVDAIQPLYTFGKLSNYVNAAENGLLAKDLQIAVEKRELALKIKNVYFALVVGYASLDLMDEVTEKIESAKKRVTKLLAKHSSEVTDLDLLKLRVFDTDLKKRYLDVRADMDTGKRALMVLLGQEPDNGIDVKEKNLYPLIIDSIKNVEDYYKIARDNRAELKQLGAAVEIKNSLMKAVKSDFYPTIFLGAQFDYGIAPGRAEYNNPYLSDKFNKLSGGAALGLNQNLNFFLTNARYRQAKVEYEKMLEQSKLASNAILLEIRDSYQDLVSNREAMIVTKDGFIDARSWTTSAYLSFDMGTLPTKDLIEAFIAYTKTKMEYLGAIFNYNMALSKLSRATGTELSKLSY